MGRISQQTTEHLATYMKDATPYGKTQIKFKFTNKEAGSQAYELLMQDYADVCDKQYGEDTPKIFRLGFVDADTRTAVLSEIKQAVAAYNASGTGGADKYIEKISGWITYLLIGVAAVVIFVLLWKKYKK